MISVAEAVRRRMECDLHDGTQQRLVSVAMSLGLVDAKLARARSGEADRRPGTRRADPAGSGLSGLVERVAALGERLAIVSPRGCGTTVRAEIPCA
jgi:signal transduction histidine kinase